jgi:NADH-quinone oxidoreductase subunit G
VLAALADEVGIDIALPDAAAVRAELAKLGSWQGTPAAPPNVASTQRAQPSAGQAVLAGWRLLLDGGRLQDGEPHLAGTSRATVVRLSEATAAEIGVAEGELVAVSTPSGTISVPLEITDMPDRVAWLPLNSPGSTVAATLGASVGELVAISQEGHGA